MWILKDNYYRYINSLVWGKKEEKAQTNLLIPFVPSETKS
jgi:hypothetical protein